MNYDVVAFSSTTAAAAVVVVLVFLFVCINMRRSAQDYRIGSRTVSRSYFFLPLPLHLSLFECEKHIWMKKNKTKKKKDNEPHHSSVFNKERKKQNNTDIAN